MMPLNENAIIINKKVGETPLEALERFRAEAVASGRQELKSVPMTYAGRLDPMAEGQLLLLIGDECRRKEEYLGLDKEYEVEIVFGISTDSYDALGIPILGVSQNTYVGHMDISRYVGRFTQPYPPYSSKTFNGEQLHELARRDELPEEMPAKEVEIYEISPIGPTYGITGRALRSLVIKKIDSVKGDFRQEIIKKAWTDLFMMPTYVGHMGFEVIKIKVACSSGTYMRSLADRIGKDLGCGAFALSIRRTKIDIHN